MSQPNDSPDGEGLTRRQAIAGGAGLALAAGLPAHAQTGAAAATARGTVFEDADGNGQRRGLPGVMVSNGRDVVLTGADGGWSLPVEPGQSVFVIKPTGYMTPLDPVTQLPHYATLYQPEGTPADLGLRFAGVAPTGTLPAQHRLRAAQAGGARGVHRPAVHRSAAREPGRAGLRARRRGGDGGGRGRGVRHHPRRHHVRRPVLLSPQQPHRRQRRPALVQLLRQPRHEPRGAGRHVLPRDLQARVRRALQRHAVWRRHVPAAGQRGIPRHRPVAGPTATASIAAGSAPGSSPSCATCWPTCRRTAWW